MSTKFDVVLRAQDSSAMLRPPITAIAPSAINSLLCIRWLRRLKSAGHGAKRPATDCRATPSAHANRRARHAVAARRNLRARPPETGAGGSLVARAAFSRLAWYSTDANGIVRRMR